MILIINIICARLDINSKNTHYPTEMTREKGRCVDFAKGTDCENQYQIIALAGHVA